jgi:hypothetical protein
VRVLIGSTQKMGTGTNVQKRLVALHHLDAPWKPAEVEQREGRILRQGNTNEEVAIYRYVTEGSFDAYMWQALETKARFISQVITGDNAARRAEDIGGQELSYAEVKAIASGNPAVLTLAEADAELQRLNLLKKNHLDEQYVARRSVRDLPGTIGSLTERLTKLSTDEATATAHASDPVTIGKRAWGREDVPAMLAGQLDFLPRNVRETTRVPLGIYHGLRFGMVLHPQFPPDVYLEGAITRQSGLSRDHQGPRAVLNALERLATGYGSECVRVRQDLAIAESQLRDYRERLGKPFLHDKYLCELTELRDQLKTGLSSAALQSGNEEGPSVSDLAEKIKALKAANTIEATPQRARQKHSSAEEPVTARIRRRKEAVPASSPSIESDDAASLRRGVGMQPLPEGETRAGGRAMLDAFASVGAHHFDLTLTDAAGHKVEFRPGLTIEELRPALDQMLGDAATHQHNVIVRPRTDRATLVQLDDLDASAAERVKSASFLILCTSPGSYQAWVAVGDADADFAGRLRKGAGADPAASGATRVSGSLNFKEKYAPAFPRVETVYTNPGLVVRIIRGA